MAFAAKYPGVCAECDGPIKTGQQITYVSDELVHVLCPIDPNVRRPICPVCHLEIPLTGECCE